MIKIEDGDYCKTCKLIDKYNELEEENKELKGQLETYKILLKVNLERIDKAKEYIENNYIEVLKYDGDPCEEGTYEIVNFELLEILKGGDSNE